MARLLALAGSPAGAEGLVFVENTGAVTVERMLRLPPEQGEIGAG